MSYMSQENKKSLAPAIKVILKKYGMKGTLAVENHSGLVLNLSKGSLDILGNSYESDVANQWKRPQYPAVKQDNIQVNTYHIDSHYTGKVAEFLTEVHDAMMIGNHNNSDIMSDYFDVGWYTYINVGKWNKPYIFEV